MLHVLIGAAVGAVVGGAASAVTSIVKGQPVDWKSVGAAAIGGAAAGSIASLTFGAGLLAGSAATQFGGMVAAGAAGGFSEQVSDNVLHDREWDEEVAEATAVGAAIGGVAGVARVAAKPLANLARSGAVRGAFESVKRVGSRVLRTRAGKKLAGRAVRAVARHPAVRRVTGRVASNPAVRRVLGGTKRLWGRYVGALDKNPVRTKALTSGSISFTGDLVAQLTDGRPGINWRQLAYRTGWSLLISGPAGHKWFNFLDKVVPGTGAKAVAGKVAIDQLLYAPASATAFFTGYNALVEGERPGAAARSGLEDVKEMQPKSWMFWPAFHSINFRHIPLNLRVPAAKAVGLGWSVIFSKLAFGGGEEAAEGADAADAAGAAASEAAAGSETGLDPTTDLTADVPEGLTLRDAAELAGAVFGDDAASAAGAPRGGGDFFSSVRGRYTGGAAFGAAPQAETGVVETLAGLQR